MGSSKDSTINCLISGKALILSEITFYWRFGMPEKLEVGGVTAGRGELKKGLIKGVELVNTASIDIPVLVMNGAEDGPILLLMSTQHGIEIQGIEVIHKVMREEVDPKNLRGAVIGIPVGNPLAYMHQTERLAYALQEEAWSKADLIVNIHCNTRPDSLIYQWINVGNPATREKLIKMAEVFGATTIVSDSAPKEDAPPTLGTLAARKGVPVILEELIDGRWISEPSTSAGVKGVLNIMKAFDMIDGEIETQEGFPVVKRGGLIRYFKEPGEFFKKGEKLAEIYDLYGDVLEVVEMPVDGYVWAYPCGQSLGTSGSLQAVQSGANIAYVFTHEKDWPP
jgi:predicted deacylase